MADDFVGASIEGIDEWGGAATFPTVAQEANACLHT